MTTVTCHDGTRVSPDSQRWHDEMKARNLLRLGLPSRRAELERVERERNGHETANELRRLMVSIANAIAEGRDQTNEEPA